MAAEDEDDVEIPAKKKPAADGITPAVLARVLGGQADYLDQVKQREIANGAHEGELHRRILECYDEIRRRDATIADLQKQLADRDRADQTLESERIKAGVEQARSQARGEMAKEFFQTARFLGAEIVRAQAKIRDYSDADLSHAEDLCTHIAAFLQALSATPGGQELVNTHLPLEFHELVTAMQAYRARHAREGNGPTVTVKEVKTPPAPAAPDP